jgi:hypothetical protein
MRFGVIEPADTIFGLISRSVGLATASAHGATHVSHEAIALAAAGALVVLACLVWALARVIARVIALEPRWTLSARHAIAEAGFRASATWAEFSDWVRLGR